MYRSGLKVQLAYQFIDVVFNASVSPGCHGMYGHANAVVCSEVVNNLGVHGRVLSAYLLLQDIIVDSAENLDVLDGYQSKKSGIMRHISEGRSSAQSVCFCVVLCIGVLEQCEHTGPNRYDHTHNMPPNMLETSMYIGQTDSPSSRRGGGAPCPRVDP